MLRFFQKLIYKKFVLFVGDYTSILIYFINNKPHEIVEVSNKDDKHFEPIKNLLSKYPKVPLYFLLDVSEQTFESDSVSSTNPFIFKKLLQRRLKKDFQTKNLKNYFITKNNSKSKKTDFVIVSIPQLSPLSDWLKFIKTIQNPIEAIYSLPIELQDMHHDIEIYLKKQEVKVSPSKWQMLVLQNRVGGFRIIVLYDHQLKFTRLINHDASQEINQDKADSIKNQILGTVEYLRRIGFKDKHGINIYLIISPILQEFINENNIRGYDLAYISPEDINKIIYKKKYKNNNYKTADETAVSYFITKGKYLKFLTKTLEQVSLYININITSSIVLLFTVFSVIIFILFNSYTINNIKGNTSKYEFRKEKLAKKLEVIREEKFGFDIDEDKVIDVAKLHNKLTSDIIDPFDIIMKFSAIKPNNIDLNSFSWLLKGNKKTEFKISAIFLSKNLSYEDLFTQYDTFIRNIKTEFSTYDVEHSELPDTISFDTNLEDIPITLQISGPK